MKGIRPVISVPFTQDQFLDVFGVYNTSLWPFALVLWMLTLLTIVFVLLRKPGAARFMNVVLVVHWAWAAVVYHAGLFSSISSAAWLFSGLFILEAALLSWHGVVHRGLQFSCDRSLRRVISWVLIAFAMLYPVIVLADGFALPRAPTFGVPCPTTILTLGLLLSVRGRAPTATIFIPTLWSVIGGSAALLFGVHADLVMVAGAVVLIAKQIVSLRRRDVPVLALDDHR
jgi:hypothetical protein